MVTFNAYPLPTSRKLLEEDVLALSSPQAQGEVRLIYLRE